ncbi:MAG: S1 RNA-binding domain-containing protein, partial [Clostridiales bacterium]|nr:S1 RNA-binding domain-containing protein [Clostridiales bacterium]
YAPRILFMKINPEKIGDVVGKQGKVLNAIIAQTGTKIDIEDDGTVCIASFGDSAAALQAKAIIESIVHDPEVGDMFVGKVVRILSTMGAFVEFAPGKDGMIHISKLSDKRVEKVEDVLSIGDLVKVKIIKIGEKGIDFKLIEKM